MKYENPLCPLFAIYIHLPKLNVAGSIPVSRSKRISSFQLSASICAAFALHSHHQQATSPTDFFLAVDRPEAYFRLATAYWRFGSPRGYGWLIGDRLAVHSEFVHRRRVRSAHDEEVGPAHAGAPRIADDPAVDQSQFSEAGPSTVASLSRPHARRRAGVVAQRLLCHRCWRCRRRGPLGSGEVEKFEQIWLSGIAGSEMD